MQWNSLVRRFWPYILAAICTALVFILKLTLPGLSNDAPYLLWAADIAIIAMAGGYTPSIAVAVFAVILTYRFFVSASTPAIPDVIVEAFALIVTAIIIGALGQNLREALTSALGAKRRFQAIVTHLAEGILECTNDGTITYANPSARYLLGYEEPLEGANLSLIIPAKYYERHATARRRYVETGQRVLEWEHTHFPAVRRDGTIIHLDVALSEYTVDDDHRFCAIIRRARDAA